MQHLDNTDLIDVIALADERLFHLVDGAWICRKDAEANHYGDDIDATGLVRDNRAMFTVTADGQTLLPSQAGMDALERSRWLTKHPIRAAIKRFAGR